MGSTLLLPFQPLVLRLVLTLGTNDQRLTSRGCRVAFSPRPRSLDRLVIRCGEQKALVEGQVDGPDRQKVEL